MCEALSFLNPIPWALGIGIVISVVYYVASYAGARVFIRETAAERAPAGGEPLAVSILKPLKGLEPDLYANLATFCRQEYGPFEVLFGVADADDPAADVVRALKADHPGVAIELVVDDRLYGTNHKISNLQNMYRVARHPVIVLADSDIRVAPDYLRRLVEPLRDPKVGIVTCLYRAAGGSGGPNLIERLFVNTDFAPSVLVARMVETRRYAFGATIAMRRAVLDEIGGFLGLRNYLADDFYLGYRVAERGYEVALSDVIVETVPAIDRWEDLLAHQVRWARTNRSSRPASYFAQVMTHGILWATLNLLYHGTPGAALVAAVVYGVRIVSASRIANRYLGARLRVHEALLVPIKDLLLSAIWVSAFLGDRVQWSGNDFRVLPSGEMVAMTPARYVRPAVDEAIAKGES